MTTSPLDFFLALSRRGGALARFDWHGRLAGLINDPALVKHVLDDGWPGFWNPHHEYADLAAVLTPQGRLLLNLAGDAQSPASEALSRLEAQVLEANERLFESLDAFARDGCLIEAVSWLKIFSVQLFTQLLFDVRTDRGVISFLQASEELEVRVTQRHGVSDSPADQRAWQAQRLFASRLLAASNPGAGEPPTIRPEATATPGLVTAVIRTLLNGYNATATAFCWCLYLLTRHPDVEARVFIELESTLGGRRPTFSDLPRLSWLKATLEESLRLYPPAWLLKRTARVPQQLGGKPIPTGTLLYISPFTLHRDPRFWNRPGLFRPERFLNGKSTGKDPQRPRYVYLPFGGGPRRCPAKPLSVPLLILLLADWLTRYRTVAAAGSRVAPWPLISLRPYPGMPVRLERRQ